MRHRNMQFKLRALIICAAAHDVALDRQLALIETRLFAGAGNVGTPGWTPRQFLRRAPRRRLRRRTAAGMRATPPLAATLNPAAPRAPAPMHGAVPSPGERSARGAIGVAPGESARSVRLTNARFGPHEER